MAFFPASFSVSEITGQPSQVSFLPSWTVRRRRENPGFLCAGIKKSRPEKDGILMEMVRGIGFEPTTSTMSRCCSTTELTARLEVRADYYPIGAERAILFLGERPFWQERVWLPDERKTLICLPMLSFPVNLQGTIPKCDEQTFNFCIVRRARIQRFRRFHGPGPPV